MTLSPLARQVLVHETHKDWEAKLEQKRAEPIPRDTLTPFERANTIGSVCQLPEVGDRK